MVDATRGTVAVEMEVGEELATKGKVAITTVVDRIPLAFATFERYNG